tara:strand:+ start:57 stop:608 length:552 start_codon:yes stop_codon:yes gene_type:complete
MKIKDVIYEIEGTLENEMDTFDDGGKTDKNCEGWIEALKYVLGLLKPKEEPESVTIIDPSLQAYIDGVALNILHQNYYKSTNGIWCKAEVDECCDDGEGEFWMVDVDFGCQDDTRNEQYRERITVNKDKDGNWTMLGLTYPNVIPGVKSNNYCDCGNTYEWTCKHECPNDRPSTAHPKYEETK